MCIRDRILSSYEKTGKSFNESEVKILCPNPNPSKSLCLALNYGSHLGERGAPTRPEPFYKTSTALIGPGDPIKIHPEAGLVACESELVAIIGKVAKNVSEEEALDYVFGYTCGNDVSAREWQGGDDADNQWWRAKSADTFGPLGPYIVTEIDPQNVGIKGEDQYSYCMANNSCRFPSVNHSHGDICACYGYWGDDLCRLEGRVPLISL